MALFMLMGMYSPEAIKAMMDSGGNREAAAREAIARDETHVLLSGEIRREHAASTAR